MKYQGFTRDIRPIRARENPEWKHQPKADPRTPEELAALEEMEAKVWARSQAGEYTSKLHKAVFERLRLKLVPDLTGPTERSRDAYAGPKMAAILVEKGLLKKPDWAVHTAPILSWYSDDELIEVLEQLSKEEA